MKKPFIFIIIVLASVLLFSCAKLADNKVAIDQVNIKLSDIDDYKTNITEPFFNEPNTFRSIPFGSTMQQVLDTETLPLLETYSDMFYYDTTQFFSYNMHPCYQFNKSGMLYCGYSHMQRSMLFPTVDDLFKQLRFVYVDPAQKCYYNYNNEMINYDTLEQGQSAIENEEAYYYIYFEQDLFDIEVFEEIASDLKEADKPV